MAQAHIFSGICGFETLIKAHMDGDECVLTITSACKSIQRLANGLVRVDPYREFTYRGEGPVIFELAAQYCAHAACPVPIGIIKAVEVAAGLALPKDVSIRLSQSE